MNMLQHSRNPESRLFFQKTRGKFKMATIKTRLKNTWNAFMGRDPTNYQYNYSYGNSYRMDRVRLNYTNLKTVVSSVYNRIAVDCAAVNINHVKLDDNKRYKETIDSSLNYCLTQESNIDQTGRNLIQDIVTSMLDEGSVAVVPTITSDEEPYKIYEIRVGKIVEWYPYEVRIRMYNDLTGQMDEIICPKSLVAIMENPFYATMNEPNSTAQRLMRVVNQLDELNDRISANKLDLIIQVPYLARSELQIDRAESRRKNIEAQLTGSQYGIAWIDGTERVIQLNRPVENNLLEQAEILKKDLYNQLGLSESIFNGTADEQTMLNYHNQTIAPILTEIVEQMERKWLTKTARTQGQAIRYFSDPFKLVPVNKIAEIADKFTRNEIMTSNEIRSVIGMKPSTDPKADELRNSNLNHPDEEGTRSTVIDKVIKE